jgi:hypothetical protein
MRDTRVRKEAERAERKTKGRMTAKRAVKCLKLSTTTLRIRI